MHCCDNFLLLTLAFPCKQRAYHPWSTVKNAQNRDCLYVCPVFGGPIAVLLTGVAVRRRFIATASFCQSVGVDLALLHWILMFVLFLGNTISNLVMIFPPLVGGIIALRDGAEKRHVCNFFALCGKYMRILQFVPIYIDILWCYNYKR